MSNDVKCKICAAAAEFVFRKTVLHNYDVAYYQCTQCGFLQTEDPYWLDEAYNSAITSLDIGLLSRNVSLRNRLAFIIEKHYPKAKCLDYAGGYGTFTRLMRDWGFDFHHIDPYCENIFAKNFTVTETDAPFALITAFELFEHMADPRTELAKILTYGSDIVLTTEFQPQDGSALADWWYIVPETGQHVSFYTLKSLTHLAGQFGLNIYSDGRSVHVLTRKNLPDKILTENRWQRWVRKYKLARVPDDSKFLQQDFMFIKQQMNQNS